MPIAALCEVRDRAATILRGLGYLAAVQVPPQRIEAGGTVRMDVLAARLVEVQLRGDAGHSERLIAAHLEQLTEREWFNTREAERHLLLLEDLPGYDVRLVLRSAGARAGRSGRRRGRRAPPVRAGRRRAEPRRRARPGAKARSPRSPPTTCSASATAPRVSIYNTLDWDEQRIIRVAHDLALGADGLRLGGSVLFGHSEPDLGGAPFETDTFTAEGHLSLPARAPAGPVAVRQRAGSRWSTRSCRSAARCSATTSCASLFVAARSRAGRPRQRARARRLLARASRAGAARCRSSCARGSPGSARATTATRSPTASPPNVPISNFAADPSAFVARLEGTFEFRPVPLVTVALRRWRRCSDGPLLSYEQASLGNYTIGRGFDPGVALGDRALGALVRAALRQPVSRAAPTPSRSSRSCSSTSPRPGSTTPPARPIRAAC